ncbi:transposase [Bacillus cytotoxicus]|uniref:transposase n=1 Tax=Bacillus cytotoxicus TaxID=580165 RepID=UPI0008643D76|nr:transposase [Bacillus cytotoxicus]AWC27665.1 hypothetical protein CG483_004230 [Bacillus cytotoxicus]AWC40959.1 hypothetical protein CG480_011025 [Bacillus cytotoxicus]AWC48890.1 hypothetical protein CG478_011025 [Bacillus cytotoxicus]AWC51732.1 hypothetical protein CG477_004225 [Bacillus cytotoxicus]AWC55860.1 hypothetical protein CG476_004225 [Bacillus cytotoxicus]
MRMKEDHMNNGQLKAGYHVQVGTENQFIIGYSLHQNPTDTRCFAPYLEKLAQSNLPFPTRSVADTGYGSETNYVYAEEQEFKVLIPPPMMRKEEFPSYKKEIRHASNWEYKEHDDYYICPNNRKVIFKQYLQRTDSYSYTRDFKIYECEECSNHSKRNVQKRREIAKYTTTQCMKNETRKQNEAFGLTKEHKSTPSER